MRLKSKPRATPLAPRARKSRARQRQRLIDACISALHLYGPSRTTVEKVVAIAKMSPGIVRFYFDSKAAMLVASLQFLAAEFDEQLLIPVAAMKDDPIGALESMVDLYLDPHIASPRKVSVWYAFWGEASSRQEYYDICGQKDESFAALVRDLVQRLIIATGRTHLDPDGIALGLIGALEVLWQDFAFREEQDIDRSAAKRRCMAFLESVFPGAFERTPERAADHVPGRGSERLAWCDAVASQAHERNAVFRGAWGCAGHESQIPQNADFLTVELAAERVLLLRAASGQVLAWRNNCPITPHQLVTKASGRLTDELECRAHGRRFVLADLHALQVETIAGLLFVRAPTGDSGGYLLPSARGLPLDLTVLDAAREIPVDADWQVVVEQWLEGARQESWTFTPPETWSGRLYTRAVTGETASWQRRFVAPNQLLEIRPDGVSVIAVLPASAGRSRVRRLDCTTLPPENGARAILFLAQRLGPFARRAGVEVAESLQQGIAGFGYA